LQFDCLSRPKCIAERQSIAVGITVSEYITKCITFGIADVCADSLAVTEYIAIRIANSIPIGITIPKYITICITVSELIAVSFSISEFIAVIVSECIAVCLTVG